MRKSASVRKTDRVQSAPVNSDRAAKEQDPKVETAAGSKKDRLPNAKQQAAVGSVSVELAAENASRKSAALLPVEREKLQGDLIAMRARYRDGAIEAASNGEKYEQLSSTLKSLLDEEFPGWDSADSTTKRSNMVDLYFQYREDAERAASIQDKFERLTGDIEAVLNEEFPDWRR